MLRMSHYPFQSTRINAESEMESTNLLLQAGYIRQEVAGAYNYLHLWLRTLDNVRAIIKKNLEEFWSFEIQMTAVGAREHWEQTGRDKTVDVLFKLEFSDGRYNFLNPTHEEIITPIMKEFIKSYKDLPTSVFQVQTKFRNEKRAKSWILRGREFLMKDMYSFHTTIEDLDTYYEQAIQVYHTIFKELGIGDDTYLTYASGGTFSKYSHEFQTLTPLGEDIIYVDKERKIALNKEIIDDPEVKKEFADYHFEEARASEVGNIFKLSTKFTDPFEVKYTDTDGNLKEVYMGCYGIGVSRTMGIIAEKLRDEKGLVRPENIAPYDYYLVVIGGETELQKAEELALALEKNWKSVILDDRAINPGAKMKDSELFGIPHRVVISPKSLEAGGYEYQKRTETERKILSKEEIVNS